MMLRLSWELGVVFFSGSERRGTAGARASAFVGGERRLSLFVLRVPPLPHGARELLAQLEQRLLERLLLPEHGCVVWLSEGLRLKTKVSRDSCCLLFAWFESSRQRRGEREAAMLAMNDAVLS